jgi:uncharacterized protein (TIGR03083 family)
MEIQDIYAAQQEALCAVVLEHADRSTVAVPACPHWRVRDVLAHVAGLARDAATGNLPTMDLLEQWRDDDVAVTRDTMTAEQVDRTSDRSLEDLAADWREVTGTLMPMLSGSVAFPDPAPFGLGAILVTDLAIHDQDVRTALGLPRADSGPAYSLALATYGFGVDYRIRQLGLGALGLRYGDTVRSLGEGEPAATVAADRFELLRALAGRRSRAQILAFEWDGDPGPYLGIIPAYGERADDLVD